MKVNLILLKVKLSKVEKKGKFSWLVCYIYVYSGLTIDQYVDYIASRFDNLAWARNDFWSRCYVVVVVPTRPARPRWWRVKLEFFIGHIVKTQLNLEAKES